MNGAARISPEALPLICEGIDIKSLNISKEEGFILGAVDGQLRVRHLVMMTGLGEEQTLKLIEGLVDKGVLIIHEAKEKPENKKLGAAQPGQGGIRLVIDAKSVPSGKDFEDFVDRLTNVLDRTDYYQLLGVPKTASLEEVKKAYRKLAKIFHPDQYFQTVEPAFRKKLQHVFKEINVAYQVLSDLERRKEYATQLGEKGVAGAVEELRLEVAKKVYSGPKFKLGLKMDKEKAKEEKLKKMFEGVKNTPMQAHLQKTERLFQMALEEIKKKNFKSAKTNLKLAIQLDPTGGKRYQAELARIEQLEAEVRYDKGRAAEEAGDYPEALRCYNEVAEGLPGNTKYIASQARVMIKYMNNFEKGRYLLIKLVETDSKNAEYFYLLGLAYKGLGQKRAAEVQFQKTLELDSKHREAQKELKALR